MGLRLLLGLEPGAVLPNDVASAIAVSRRLARRGLDLMELRGSPGLPLIPPVWIGFDVVVIARRRERGPV
jgi:hypothetical protein